MDSASKQNEETTSTCSEAMEMTTNSVMEKDVVSESQDAGCGENNANVEEKIEGNMKTEPVSDRSELESEPAGNLDVESENVEKKTMERQESENEASSETTPLEKTENGEEILNGSADPLDADRGKKGKSKGVKNSSEDKSIQTSIESSSGKKSKKKDAASVEEKKLVDLLVHVFDGLDSPEKKMEALAKKYIQLAADMKTTENKLEDVESKHREVKKDKEQIYSDFTKVNMAKTKLESLCRELQKQNKIIKDEIQRRADEEDRKRRDLSQKFQTTINDITTQMGENHKRNQQLKQDNTDLAQKLKGLVEQYEVREQHIEKVLKAKQLELQLCEAKLQQQTLVLQEERQNNLKEKHAALQESLDQKKKVEMLVKQEGELKSQLALYTEKFVEFQSTLTKSNEVFATFKKEMDKMTKTIRKLEKECNTWKTRYENTNVSLLQMVEERSQKDNEISVQKGKLEKLEKLCRALQLERRKLKKEMEQNEKEKKSEGDGDLSSDGKEAGNEEEEAKKASSSNEDESTETEEKQMNDISHPQSSSTNTSATSATTNDVTNRNDAGSSHESEAKSSDQ
eukprot:gene329-961_t